jgi:hypothetical protein
MLSNLLLENPQALFIEPPNDVFPILAQADDFQEVFQRRMNDSGLWRRMGHVASGGGGISVQFIQLQDI